MDVNYSAEVYEHAVRKLMQDPVVQDMSARLAAVDLTAAVAPGVAGEHNAGFAATVNAMYDMLTADTDLARPQGALVDALWRLRSGGYQVSLGGYDDYDPHSAENEPDWPEFQKDEEPPDEWVGRDQ